MNDEIRVKYETLFQIIRQTLAKAGMSAPICDIEAQVMAEADLLGVPSHGVRMLPGLVQAIREGRATANPQLRILRERAATCLLDGDHGPGRFVSVQAMQRAVERAKQFGVGVCLATRVTHWGRAHAYACRAAQAGMIGACTTNAIPNMLAWESAHPLLGNNPLAIGVPRATLRLRSRKLTEKIPARSRLCWMCNRCDMEQQTIRWGIIGCGDVAEYKSGPALYLTPGSELVAVMRRDAAKAQDFARRHGAKRWYTDAESLVADPEVNAVYIASPHDGHPEHVALAARARKIVLCEKPMGVNVAQAQACVDVCKANDVPLTVAYYRRFWPVTQAMLNFLREGAIGQVVHAHAQVTDYFAGDNERSWLTSLAKSGGDALANSGAHWVDLIRFLLGDVADVMAHCSSKFSRFETDDTAVVQMRMADGALVSLTSTRQTPVSTNELDIFGTEGRLYASPLSDGRLVLHQRGRAPEVLQYPRHGVTHSELIAKLVKCMLNDQPSPLPGEEAVAVWKIMEAAYHSSAEGVRIAIR